MGAIIKPITALLLSAAIVLAGNGLENVLLPLRAELEGFSRLDIGLVGSAYFAGLMAGCLICPRIIGRVGNIRSFAVFTAIATMSPLIEAIWPLPGVWWAARGLTGMCFAGLLTIIESWLNSAATNETRGGVLASYTIINFGVLAIGQQLLNAGDPASFQLFSLVAILFSLAAVPIALTRTIPPSPPVRPRLRLGWLARISPGSIAGCFGAGLANGAFWSLAPVYARSGGLPVSSIAVFMTAAVLGGALSQWPVGRLSDRVDRRHVLVAISGGAALTGLALFTTKGASLPVTLALALAFGATALPVYWLAIAHAHDLVSRDDAVEVSSNLLLVFAAAAIMGPVLASLTMEGLGAAGLFLYTAAVHLITGAVVLLRSRIRAALPPEEREAYVAIPRPMTPTVYELDPRTAPSDEQDAGTPDSIVDAEQVKP